MVINQTKIILLLILCFSFIIAQEEEEIPEIIKPSKDIIEITYNSKKNSFKGNAEDAYKVQKYKVKFNSINDIPENIKFELYSKDNINKVISFSPTDSDGRKDRIQLSQLGTETNSTTWIKKDQLTSEYLYVVVECQIEEGKTCDYLMDINGNENIVFDSPNFNYNFYVNKKNQQMKIKVLRDESSKNQVLSVYAIGGKTIVIKVETDRGDYFYGENILIGQALTTRIKSFNYFILTIDSEEGDYITLGSKLILDEESEMNILKPNGYQLTGFLKTGTLEEECYFISDDNIYNKKTSFIVGLFYNKEAKIYYKDRNFRNIGENPEITKKGYYTYNYREEDNNRKYICISFSDEEMDTLVYTLQFFQPGNQYGFSNIYSPQSNGNIYPRILEKGSYAFFNGLNLNPNSEELIYNMIAKEGLPTMYIYRCNNYPLCEFDPNNEGMIKINEINLMSTWHNKEKTSPIDARQYVMFVYCQDSQNNICQFDTSIYGNLDKIFLSEKQTFSQYILKGQVAHYYIDFSQEIEDVKKVYIDILIINGDISIDTVDSDNKNIAYEKYILSNKIFYSIHPNRNSNLERIIVDIEAKMNSYYIIEYKLVRTSDDESTNDIYTGINYLIPIPKDKDKKEKIINIHNSKLLKDESYFTSFYSLNCKFEILRGEEKGNYKPIQSYGNYGQDIKIINENEMNDIYSYKIILTDDVISNYNNDMCMIYVSSIELMNEEKYDLQKEILITEGIPQRIHFTKNDYKIKYIYPILNKDKDVAIYFRVINPAKYEFAIAYNNDEDQREHFYQSKIIYLEQNKINSFCEDNELCNIIVSIELDEEIENDGNIPILEISMKEIGNNIPYYLPIGVARTDFLSGLNKLNLFTTLGKDDKGYITLDFARGSGLIYAKIVPIDGDGDENPEWRQYELPKTKDNTLKYDFYNKKILIQSEDTKECEKGCYLLLSIETSTTGPFNENFRTHQLSITVNLIPKTDLKENGPIIKIQPEQYIIGSLTDDIKTEDNEMYEFYQLNIPFDARTIEIDWQSDSSIFLLNIGEERPLIDSKFRIIESRSDTVLEIKNEEIKKELGSAKNINNAYLTIGVYSNILESPYGNPYSFRVHFTRDLNIYRVDSDQKTLCKPENIGNNEYRCLFMLIYGKFDLFYDTMIYAKSQSLTASTYMYGKFITNKIYDDFEEDTLETAIPNEESTYNTKRDKIDFIFLTMSDVDSHLYVSVVSDKQDVIEFISSFKTFDTELSPNPSSVQLFALNNAANITLKFKTTKPILINIVSLYGSSKLHFQDDAEVEYSLRGRDDRISLAIPYDGKEENLIIENINFNPNDSNINLDDNVKMPGIAFYLEYYLRSNNINFDEIYLGKTSEIAYHQSDFPFYYYSKLNDLNKDINIFFNLHDLEFTSLSEFRIMNPDDLIIRAKVVSQNTVYNIKTGKQSISNDENAMEGKYDPALMAGHIFLSTDYLKKFKDIKNPTLSLSLEKKRNNNIFKRIRLELTATEKNSEIPVTEKIYQYGNIKSNEVVSYKLKVDNYTGDMRIQFAANSKKVKFAINDSPNQKKNMTLNSFVEKEERGKIFLTFNKPKVDYIYLNIYVDDDKIDSRLNNYVFKYMNSIDRKNFFEYPILDDNGTITPNYENSKLKVKFNKIDRKNVDITYSLKIIKKWDKIKEEINKTIAFNEYSSTVVQVYNPTENEIILEKDNVYREDFCYAEIIAQIKDGPIIEYVAYDPFYLSDDYNEEDDDDDDDDDKILIIVASSIGGAILIIVIALIVVVMLYNRKTKDLLEKVNKISFADGDDRKDKNNNLLVGDNELK